MVKTWSTWFGTHLVENNKIYGQKICQTPKNVKTHKYTWAIIHLNKGAAYELPKHCVSKVQKNACILRMLCP